MVGTLCVLSEITVDVSQPPFCVIRHPQEHREEDFEDLFVRLRKIIPGGSKWAVLVDLQHTSALRGSDREFTSAAILKNLDFIEGLMLCEARVAPRPLMRGALTVLDWITPRSWPIKNFRSGIVAEDWLRTRLAAAGISAPEQRIWVEPAIASTSNR
tara:strand:- start:31754 stop:32224 length:471 start_codon:yes stop_codon:yes gene_type:complete